MEDESLKVSIVCHGNIARSQVLQHYLAEHAGRRSMDIDLYSCGTAPLDAYPNADLLLDEVRDELRKRGLNRPVLRNVLDDESLQHLLGSDLILVADSNRRKEVLARLGKKGRSKKIVLFYEFIGEGPKDFTDTYNPKSRAQDPERFSNCFDELERIAQAAIECIQTTGSQPPRIFPTE